MSPPADSQARAQPRVQAWLGESPDANVRSLHTARRHVEAETTADTDAICATVSQNVFFAVPHRTRGGQQLPSDSVLSDHASVRAYYEGRADSYVVLASSQLASIASGWYVFNESAATLRATGPIGDVDAAGREFVVNSAILFPTAPDGIRGEICITRHPFEDVVAGRVAPAASDGQAPEAELGAERAQADLLDRMLGHLREGDAAALASFMTPEHALAIRIDDPDGQPAIRTARERAEAGPALEAVFAGTSDVALITRLVSRWYVFGEFRARLEDGGLRHVALLQSVDDGRLSGSFGYGWEEARADPHHR